MTCNRPDGAGSGGRLRIDGSAVLGAPATKADAENEDLTPTAREH